MKKTIIFQIDGGLGKSIMGTAVLRAIRKQYLNDYIIVVTSYPDVFIGNPNANKILNHTQTSGIYKKHIMNKDCKVFFADPYSTSDYVTESKHLVEIWCEMFGISYDGETPELFISNSEKQYFEKFYRTDKPIFAIQTNGGAVGQPLQYSWTRDIPETVVMEIINQFKDKYTILHIKREDQPIYPDTLQALDSFRSIAILLSLAKKRLLIDSSAMHIAQSIGLSSVVLWVGTNPKVFGYENNQNIIANPPTKEVNLEHNNYLKHLLFEDLGTIPYYDLNEVFDIDTIIEAIKKES